MFLSRTEHIFTRSERISTRSENIFPRRKHIFTRNERILNLQRTKIALVVRTTQADESIHCLLTESMDIVEYLDRDYMDAQAYLDLRCLHIASWPVFTHCVLFVISSRKHT